MSETTETAEVVTSDDLAELLRQAKEDRAKDRARAESAETRASRAEQERDEARGTAATHVDARYLAEEAAVSARIAANEQQADQLQRDAAAAYAEGRFDDAAAAQRKMAKIEALVLKDTDYQTWLGAEKERQAKAAEMARQQPQPRQQQGVDLSQFSAKQRAWIEDHPEYMTDERFRKRVAAAHYLAEADGVQIDSDDYFKVIDQHTGGKEPRRTRASDDDSAELPVQRGNSGGGSRRAGTISLNSDQREAADMAFSDVPVDDYTENGVVKPGRYKLYAKNMEVLKKEGRL